MSITFSSERWAEVKQRNRLWRERKLGQPLIQVRLTGVPPHGPPPDVPPVSRSTTSYDRRYTPRQIVGRWDWELSQQRWMGDGFPHVWIDFGPGVLAVFLGGEAKVESDTVWFHPGRHEGRPLEELHLKFDENDEWFRRILEIGQTAARHWDGLVQVGMTDLGGTMDVLASLRGSHNLLLDLYDHPEQVKRLMWEIHEAWFAAYERLDRAMRPPNPGCSSWSGVFSEEPGYMLQCDFAYMISPEMFDEFVKPELEQACRRLGGRAFYHLDGVGQLPHLDSLLRIDALAGIQWIPGAGQPPTEQWIDVHRRILEAGKLNQMYGKPRTLDSIARELGTVENVLIIIDDSIAREADYREWLRKYGVPG